MKINRIINPYSRYLLMVEANDLDFEGGGNAGGGSSGGSGNGEGQGGEGEGKGGDDDKTPLDGKGDKADLDKQGKGGEGEGDGNKGEGNDGEGDGSGASETELSEGDTIEYDGATYTVDKDGNIVDKDNKIFVEAKNVKEWLSKQETEESNGGEGGELNIEAIQDALGISITDEDGKPVEFTNDKEGIKSYINSVMELKTKDIQEATINKLYADNPLVKQFIDYCQVTGSPRGFGEIPDRSGIELDKDNENQLEYVIRMAAAEFGNKSLDDNYIKYLKSNGGLYDVAKAQLEALVEKDKNYRTQIEAQAEQERKDNEARITAYWNNVNKIIDGREIAGYKIPETFIKEVNGTKVTLTPNDFYKYLSRQIEDAEGNRMTSYQRDLNNLTDDELLNRELIDAWLMFTGGSYKDLIDMAVAEHQVKTLRLKSKEQRTGKTVKITKVNNGKTNLEDLVLG